MFFALYVGKIILIQTFLLVFFRLSTYSGLEIEAAMKRALVNKNNSGIALNFSFFIR